MGRFMRSAERVVNFARLVLEAVGILELLHAKDALRRKKVWPLLGSEPDQSQMTVPKLCRTRTGCGPVTDVGLSQLQLQPEAIPLRSIPAVRPA